MIFDLLPLKNKIESIIEIDGDYTIKQELLSQTEILEPLKVHMKGFIKEDTLGDFWLQLKVTGTMVLPCSVTLKPVEVPFAFEIDDNLEDLLKETLENEKKIENSIDILPIIWENILMEIPMKVTSPDVDSIKKEGEGWKLVTDENVERVNPALEKLKDLL